MTAVELAHTHRLLKSRSRHPVLGGAIICLDCSLFVLQPHGMPDYSSVRMADWVKEEWPE